MYTKPTLRKFGTFRELTLLGFNGASDQVFIAGIGTSPGSGCHITNNQLSCLPNSPTAS